MWRDGQGWRMRAGMEGVDRDDHRYPNLSCGHMSHPSHDWPIHPHHGGSHRPCKPSPPWQGFLNSDTFDSNSIIRVKLRCVKKNRMNSYRCYKSKECEQCNAPQCPLMTLFCCCYFLILKKIVQKRFLGRHTQMSYFGTTDTPVLDIWWHLLWVSKPECAALFPLRRGM